ncbi:MAG: PAS domain S-box protein, partial [Thermodesulfovibrionales bacterium]|nr:PAS domain S-box protein [Thermodesulfovibrionales bacterium]
AICVSNAKEALEKLKQYDIGILISDLSMPKMDGIALLKSAREIDPHLICIILTGHASIQSAVEAMKYGAFDFIIKPLDFKVFKYIIERASEVRQLHNLKEMYYSIVESYQTEFIFRFLPDTTLTFVNDSYCKFLENTKEHLIGRKITEFMSEEDREYFNHILSQITNENPVLITEYRIVKPSGRTYWQRLIIRGIFDKDGKHKENQAIGYDITEQKQTEALLRENEQKLRQIIDHSIEIFYIHDTHNRLTYISPQCKEILGYSPDEMMIEWTQLITDNPINQTGMQITNEALRTGERQKPYLLELLRKDKTRVLLEIQESPLKDETGNIRGIVGAARDVTENIRAEEEVNKRVKELEEFYQMAVSRELRMKELKENIAELKEELEKYKKE